MKNGAKKSADNSALLLKASAKRLFETLMEQTADRIYIKDRRSRFVVASHSLAKMHGFEDRHELEGLTDFDLFSIEHAQQAFEDEQEIIRSNRPMINKTEKETWPDGAVTWVASSKAPVHLNDGKVAGIIGISRDVTAEKHAQERLARSEARLREQNEIMRSDYESAKKVQGFMIPGRLPVVPGVELGYVWKPMTAVGGDIINFPRNPANALLFFMGDVCGHGVTAAFYTVLVKYLTSHSAEVYADDPRQFLNAVNEQIIGRLNEGFITGLAGHFSPKRRLPGALPLPCRPSQSPALPGRHSGDRARRLPRRDGYGATRRYGRPGREAGAATRRPVLRIHRRYPRGSGSGRR